ncbi:hypothetical protein CLAFUW4_11056 [Fulvia fulva]|uniref:Uncharacterized protein n=1 Tax=Passalora fulva TaxID=5499 RepID=A0A9Q8PD87_PASFU|nr:uncharacterized protein CLAFUR5_10098 [Fulvia fulva]KAK4619323.1 hypothetical protein CLAFUR4_11061 [Fulvia fulva]KAK4620993.1 hypothetical protein CLAFUR0_11067 [Fulvia fulva]UJO20272.1 hypothetical protein CLAFUR5_10098 [Fulvia fulva]WPV16954.1 hypothetical protein CLAFUW4_11056 [Fulvia fulva]WPV32059.1 hypothetical protein CLAFUW7_11053 [Fulvia fulva]
MSLFRSSLLRSAPRTTSLNVAARRFASGDYGSGAVKPGTPNNAVDKEHPGPPPPSVAQKGNEHKSGSNDSQKSDSNDAQKSGSSSSSGKSTSDKPQPKILSANPPAEGQEPEDVAEHNREMAQRADKAAEKVSNEDAKDDKVSKGFWSGTGGRDREP